jgi:hypothetical protein
MKIWACLGDSLSFIKLFLHRELFDWFGKFRDLASKIFRAYQAKTETHIHSMTSINLNWHFLHIRIAK